MELNFYPINFEFETYKMLTEPYSVERLSQLRIQFNKTHSFFRNGDRIFISNKTESESLSGEVIEINLYEQKEISASLIKHLFFNSFKDRFPQLVPIDFYPFRFFSSQEKDDIIHFLLPESLKGKISYMKLIEVELRSITIDRKPKFGFIINVRRNWIFNKTCADLHYEGFNLIGIEVLLREFLPNMTNILAPEEEFIGVIKEIDGDLAKVITNEGLMEYNLSSLSIRKTKYNIGSYLSYITSEQQREKIFSEIENKKHEIYNAKKLSDEINKIANSLFTQRTNGSIEPVLFQNRDGFCFTVDPKMLKFSNSITLKTPDFIFDPAATKTNPTNPDKGLTDYGPYDSQTFDIKSPYILCIGHKDNRGHFASFLSSLKDGLPNSNWFKSGFQKKYSFTNVDLKLCEVNSHDYTDYARVISTEIENGRPDLVIIEIPAAFRLLDDVNNPYYKLKAKLFQLEIPAQFIQAEKVRQPSDALLNAVSLQLYAKLGGTPWVLASNRSLDREIVIGIGHTWVRQNAFRGAAQDRVVGITTFMSSDGQYLLSDKAKDVSYDEYFGELLRSLKSSFLRLENEQGWSQGDTIRLIFHIFKPIKNVEFDVVSELVKEFGKYNIQFAFVTISKSHPFKMFDSNQSGFSRYGSNQVKGALIPNRGTNIIIDSTTSIVQMLGAKELKTDKHGMSNPLQIRIRTPQGNFQSQQIEQQLFTDLTYITQQVFSFTYLSWRSFLPGEQPATMLYSQLISQTLGKMRQIQGWDPDCLNQRLKRKKWFL